MTVIPKWNPAEELSSAEEQILKRLDRVKKLFGFLRRHRHQIFTESFQDELADMYRDTGAGKPPVPPALLAMVVLLQSYTGASDAEAVELSVMDRRWQLVLDCLDCEKPPYSQGALQNFRERMIEHDMDQRILERTVEVAKETSDFGFKQLPKSLRLAVDSSPFEGAGRVEDTINLLGHAARKLVKAVSRRTGQSMDTLAAEAGIPLVVGSSIKAGLDVDWTRPGASEDALNRLIEELDSMERWVNSQPEQDDAEVADNLVVLAEIRAQDLESCQDDSERVKIRRGVAKDRRISIEDSEMRHGRKSSSTLIDGYKRHLARDLDTGLIRSCELTAANQPEADALQPLLDQALLLEKEEDRNAEVAELYIDRGYLSSPAVGELKDAGGQIICRPWTSRNRFGNFTKDDFDIDLEAMRITCPNGQEAEIRQLDSKVAFPADACDSCPLRDRCTTSKLGRGRTIRIAADEPLQQELKRYAQTPQGREELRKRVPIEHSLAHLGARQGNKARYIGRRKNLFDVRRAATVQNLETLQRKIGEGYYRKAA